MIRKMWKSQFSWFYSKYANFWGQRFLLRLHFAVLPLRKSTWTFILLEPWSHSTKCTDLMTFLSVPVNLSQHHWQQHNTNLQMFNIPNKQKIISTVAHEQKQWGGKNNLFPTSTTFFSNMVVMVIQLWLVVDTCVHINSLDSATRSPGDVTGSHLLF